MRNEHRNAVELLLINIIRHQLHIAAWPEAPARSHRQHEIEVFQEQAERRPRRSPGFRPETEAEMPDLYRATVRMYREIDGIPRLLAPH